MPSGARRPSLAACRTAFKLLTAFARLADDRGINISPDRLSEMQSKGDNITSDDLPRKLQLIFPGEFKGMTLAEIRAVCTQRRR